MQQKRVHTVAPGTMPALQPRLSKDVKGAARNTAPRILPTGRKASSKCSLAFVYDAAKASGFRYPTGTFFRDSKAQVERDTRLAPMRHDGPFTRAR